MAGESINGVSTCKLNLFVLCDIWSSYLWLNYHAFINKRRTLSLLLIRLSSTWSGAVKNYWSSRGRKMLRLNEQKYDEEQLTDWVCEWISIFYCRYLDFLNVCFKCLKIRHDEWCVGQLHWWAAWVSPIRTKIKTAIFTQRTSPMKMVIYS